MYGCESWAVKTAEHRRIDAFELWCWRRLLRVPWTARRSNQSILKEINSGISLEGMVLKLKLWTPHAKSWLIGKDSDAGRDWEQEEKGTTEDEMSGWHHRLDGHESMNSRRWWWTGRPGVLRFMASQRVGHDWATELDWKTFNYKINYIKLLIFIFSSKDSSHPARILFLNCDYLFILEILSPKNSCSVHYT